MKMVLTEGSYQAAELSFQLAGGQILSWREVAEFDSQYLVDRSFYQSLER